MKNKKNNKGQPLPKTHQNRSAFSVMLGLIGMIKPMLGIMTLAIFMGCIGNLMAIFITVLGGIAFINVYSQTFAPAEALGMLFAGIALFAVLRGVLRYAEQACNHYIAFKLLAQIRHKVFAALRKLAPAKLDGKEKGNLISIITTDIELLEVFYAHTISPVAIAVITSGLLCLYIGSIHWALGLTALGFYFVVGAVIPVINSKKGQHKGQEYRKQYGALNTMVLDNLYGLEEIVQYGQQKERLAKMEEKTTSMEEKNGSLKNNECFQRVASDSVILLAGVVMAILGGYFASIELISGGQAVTAVIAMMSSFGPAAALSSLSNNLNQTLASGNRVLNLLAEIPVVEEIKNKKSLKEKNLHAVTQNLPAVHCQNINFSYAGRRQDRAVLHNFSKTFQHNRVYGIFGRSGCGKSTLLKLMMRFYEPVSGQIEHCGIPVDEINTSSLRSQIAYVSQDTFLFDDTIENNIKIADLSASHEAVVAAAKKASVHNFIMTLPEGYHTRLGELGAGVSGGERQRLGLARAFLHNGNVLLLDEPTSNIDSLNEGIILKSIEAEKAGKTVIIVSHRKSTMAVADEVLQMRATAG